LFITRFDHIAEIEGKIAIAEGRLFNFQSFGLLASVIGLMTVLGEILFFSGIISVSPVMIGAAIWKLIFEKTIWQHAYISFCAIFGGLAVGVVCATLIYKLLETNLRDRLFPYLLLLNITPVFSHTVLMWWLTIGYLEKSLAISLISIYPIVEILWGLRQRQLRIALPLAIVHALPYAVAMMIFGEALASTGGLGFFMIVASAARKTIPEGIAAGIILVALYLVVSEFFEYLTTLPSWGRVRNALLRRPINA
jgi:ABC-type nitrate/sulfonate/bicarbonate transport system permease component